MERIIYWIKFICITIVTALVLTGAVEFFMWLEAWLASLHLDSEIFIAGGIFIGIGIMMAYIILDE